MSMLSKIDTSNVLVLAYKKKLLSDTIMIVAVLYTYVLR